MILAHGVKSRCELGESLPAHLLSRNRNNDPPPGHQIMWQGYAVLQMLCLGFSLRPPDTS